MTAINDRIAKIMPTLEAVAYKYAGATLDEATDLVQDMVVHIITKTQANPDWEDEEKYNDNYLITAGAIAAREAMRKSRVYAKYFATWETGETDPMEEIPYDLSAEDAAIARYEVASLTKALEGLPKTQATVAYLWASGYNGKEIAVKLGVTPARVSQIKAEAMEGLRHLKYVLNTNPVYWKDL